MPRCGPTTEQAPGVPPPLTPTPSHCGETVARLGDGRILAVGKQCAELFSAGTWHPTGTPPVAVSGATLTPLADGNALLTGGQLDDAVTNVQLFEAAKGSWRAVAPLHAARFAHASLQLRDGRVLVTGGCDDTVEGCAGEGRVASYELYDPRADRWTVHPFASPRTGNALVELADGRVLSVGGAQRDSLHPPPSTVWDGSRWCDAPPLIAFRYKAHAQLRPDGTSVLVSGTPDKHGPSMAPVEIYHLDKECPTSCPK